MVHLPLAPTGPAYPLGPRAPIRLKILVGTRLLLLSIHFVPFFRSVANLLTDCLTVSIEKSEFLLSLPNARLVLLPAPMTTRETRQALGIRNRSSPRLQQSPTLLLEMEILVASSLLRTRPPPTRSCYPLLSTLLAKPLLHTAPITPSLRLIVPLEIPILHPLFVLLTIPRLTNLSNASPLHPALTLSTYLR